MTEQINQVIEFHNTTGAPVEKSPVIPNESRLELRINLIDEEFKEFQQAVWQKNRVEALDALCDMLYVIYGTVAELGMQDIIVDAFNEVHRSNMSKFCKTYEEAKASTLFYCHKKDVEAYNRKVGKNFIIRRTADDKILKGLQYTKPNLSQFIKK